MSVVIISIKSRQNKYHTVNLWKKKKKANITPENIGEIFLCQIPGINHNTAQAIMAKVDGNFSQLMEMVKTNPSDLQNIFIGKDKPRRIAKNVVNQLTLFLCWNNSR